MISVILPALNEEASIAETLTELKGVLDGASIAGYEILVVDDGSTDSTARLAAEHGARVIRHPHNTGYGRSLKDGIAAARHDTIVIADADLTYPLDEVPRLLAELDRGFDMVVGARTGPHVDESLLKKALRGLLTWLVEFTVGHKVPDVNSGLRAFRRSSVSPDLRQLCDTFSFTTSMTLAYLMQKKYVSHVPIAYRARQGASKVRLLRDGLRTLQYIVQAIVFYNPLKIFLLLSLACVCIALVSGAVGLFLGGSATAMALAATGLLAALLVFGLGLVAELLRQLLDRQR